MADSGIHQAPPPQGGSGVTPPRYVTDELRRRDQPPPGDRWRVTPAYRAMARADAVNAVAAGLIGYSPEGHANWNAAAFDLADVLTEYILTGQRPV